MAEDWRDRDIGELKRRARILVVDDEESARAALAELLSIAGYAVETAADGVEALARYQQLEPDLVVTDLRMPRMSGIELLKQLRRIAPHVPVVIMTAYEARSTGVDVFYQGASGYLTKPIDVNDLLIVVESALAEDE